MESEEEEYNIEDYYKFVENHLDKDDPRAVIELTAGPFSGMVYNYGEYKFKRAENEEDEPTIQYEFNIISIPDEIKGKEYPDVIPFKLLGGTYKQSDFTKTSGDCD